MSKACKRFFSYYESIQKSAIEKLENENRTKVFELEWSKEICYPHTDPGKYGWCYSTPYTKYYTGSEPTWGYCSYQCKLSSGDLHEKVLQVEQRLVQSILQTSILIDTTNNVRELLQSEQQIHINTVAPFSLISVIRKKRMCSAKYFVRVLPNKRCKHYQRGEIFLKEEDMCAARINTVTRE